MSSRLPPGARRVPNSLNGLTALELFRAGFDTVDIAAHFQITEAEALQTVSSQRSAFLGRSNPYPKHSLRGAGSPPLAFWPGGLRGARVLTSCLSASPASLMD